MNRIGWIKFHRKSYDNFLYKNNKPHSPREAWEDILAHVNYEDLFLNIRGEHIECRRGQSLMSLETWGNIFNWNKYKVRRFFKTLIKHEMIVLEKTKVSMRLTVCKYEDYQGNDTADLIKKSATQTATQTATANELLTQQLNNNESDSYKNTRNEVTTIPATQTATQTATDIRSKEVKKLSLIWRESFKSYSLELKSAYDELIQDQDFIKKQQEYYPDLDILLSMNKAYENFWNTEDGWQNKKKSKSTNINWKATFGLSIGNNKVLKNNSPLSEFAKQRNKKSERIL